MKLTLEHLAPYLPYGLKGTIVYSEDDKEETKLCIRDGLNNESDIDGWINGTYPVLPHLRPLSDLTREIEVNGERFVPIVELAKIHHKHISWLSVSTSSAIGTSPVCDCYDFYFEDGDFVINEHPDGFRRVNNQLQLFQKMYEWHFDVFNLIESGLAVDINQIEK